MTSGTRRAEFFALEASEYLGDLEPLVARSDTPDLERLVRGARALRGAALMAGLGTFARAAAGLEGIARQVRDHALGWEPGAREAWREGLQTLRGLIGRATTWEAADDRQALALADRLDRVAGGRSSTAVATAGHDQMPSAPGMTPGVRAFIARESALIAGSLQQAAQALAPTPPPEALAGVLQRMRSLRGIGTSSELSPLPELLDAMEVMTRGLIDSGVPSPALAGIFSAAAEALATMSKSVSDHGRVAVPPGLGEVARRLLEEHITPVPSLQSPESGASADPVPVELVGVGDHLLAQAEALGRQSSPSARDLRLFVLHRTLGSMPQRSGTGRFLAPLVRAVTTAIANGGASRDPDAFTTMLRESGEFLVEAAAASDPTALGARRDGLARAISHQSPPPPDPTGKDHPALALTESWETPVVPIASPAAVDAPDDVVPMESLAPSPPLRRPALADTQAWAAPGVEDDIVPVEALAPGPDTPPRPALGITETWETPLPDPVVPIASLAPDADEPIVDIDWLAPDDDPEVVPIATLAPEADVEVDRPGRLERAFRVARELASEHGDEPASLDGLVGAAAVEVTSLLYRGEAAVARAEELRAQLINILAEPRISLDRLRPILDELLDLVPLARDAD
jgi:hypothetical protein